MILLRILLFPFSLLYYLITQVRNYRYDHGLRSSVKFELPVICVGNLSLGGTGKTPMIEHLIRLLQDRYKLATLSRGYGRATKGIRIAETADNASTLGDEPFQFHTKFSKRVTVAVGEERALAIPTILQEHPDIQVILLDDGFQHRQVSAGFNILLTDYHRPFYNDYLLPSGRLRESRSGATRADVIVVTKCPASLPEEKMIEIERSIRGYASRPVFFTTIRYGTPKPFSKTAAAPTKQIVLISGIANSKPLEAYAVENFTLIKHLEYRDHHTYTVTDIKNFVNLRRDHPQVSFLTTEKDKVKLDVPQFHDLLNGIPLFYLPIEIDFLKAGEDFDEMVLNIVERAQ
ncbi:MAG TPA: tetraacyldisaccharide 4'-kinase [Chryseolinea sp.]